MKIACVGWGSLVWNPGALHCAGPWQSAGPLLPVEFARTSKDGRLTLVLLDGTPAVPTRFVELVYDAAETAQMSLAGREGSGVESIGLWPGPAPRYAVGAAAIAEWGAANGFDAVVWSALRPKFREMMDQVPSDAKAVVDYLRALDDEIAARARQYICKAPAEIRTPFRAVIEAKLGWSAKDGAAATQRAATEQVLRKKQGGACSRDADAAVRVQRAPSGGLHA